MTAEASGMHSPKISFRFPTDSLDTQERRLIARDLHETGQLEKALAALQVLAAQTPDDLEVWHRISDICLRLQLPKMALRACEAALKYYPEHPETLFNIGVVLSALDETAAALHCYDKVLGATPGHYGALRNRPMLLADLSQYEQAEQAASAAALAYPGDVWVHFNQGDLLLGMRKMAAAGNAFRRALALDDGFHRARYALAIALAADGNIVEAHAERSVALAAEPSLEHSYRSPLVHDHATGQGNPTPERVALLVQNEALSMCDWRNYEAATQRYSDLVAGLLGAPPLDMPEVAYMALGLPEPVNDAIRLQVVRQVAARIQRTVSNVKLLRPVHKARDRVRIAYAAGCFSPHPNARLMGHIYSRHDRDRFEVYAYGFDRPNDSAERDRVKNGVDVFREVAHLPAQSVAQMMVNDGIDILIDLSGYMLNSRPDVLAMKPAPIQIAYMDFMGTLGAAWIDYTMLDHSILLPEVRAFWDEKIAYLPHCAYHCEYPSELSVPTREEYGLPQGKLILGALHRPRKLDPATFSVWMALLHALPNAVLWLLEDSSEQRKNLCSLANEQGIASSRLIFAPPRPNHEHLARYGLVDIHLDTIAYNGHTTTVDALSAGVPVVTLCGRQAVARVAASMLQSHGLSELVTTSVEAYKDVIIRLASDSAWRARVREKTRNFPDSRLFCPERRVREIETAYEMMWARHTAGLPPEDFDVPEYQPSAADK